MLRLSRQNLCLNLVKLGLGKEICLRGLIGLRKGNERREIWKVRHHHSFTYPAALAEPGLPNA